MTVLFKRLAVFRFLTVPPSVVHGLPKYDGIPPSTGTDVQHGKITSGIFPRTTLVFLLIVCYLLSLYTKYIVLVIDYTPASGGAGKNVYLFEVYIFLLPLAKLISLP